MKDFTTGMNFQVSYFQNFKHNLLNIQNMKISCKQPVFFIQKFF